MGVPWSKIKSLFVVSENQASSTTMSSDDTAAIDAAIAKYQVPPETQAPVPQLPSDVSPSQLSGTIDFQALYDQAGIPNTDEVESLEKFLVELDAELPQTSKLAAAKAFLKATGKSSVDVLTDAARKIKVVRAIEASKADDSRTNLSRQQSAVDDLQKQIDELRTAMEGAKRDLEDVKKQCTSEEARLQGARMFFGAMDTLAEAPRSAAPGPAAKK
jgi:archaellum component FlaC